MGGGEREGGTGGGRSAYLCSDTSAAAVAGDGIGVVGDIAGRRAGVSNRSRRRKKRRSSRRTVK